MLQGPMDTNQQDCARAATGMDLFRARAYSFALGDHLRSFRFDEQSKASANLLPVPGAIPGAGADSIVTKLQVERCTRESAKWRWVRSAGGSGASWHGKSRPPHAQSAPRTIGLIECSGRREIKPIAFLVE